VQPASNQKKTNMVDAGAVNWTLPIGLKPSEQAQYEQAQY